MDSFEYILAVAEEKNMTKAAAKLFVTQPALSISINRLEKQLGFKIFDRTKSPIELTSEGSLYIQEIRRIRQEEEEESLYMGRLLKSDIFVLDQQKHVPISKKRYAQTRKYFEEYLGNGEL